jgi:glycosyltransferase involved in cell wall biosynthesis
VNQITGSILILHGGTPATFRAQLARDRTTELLGDGRGALVPFDDPDALADKTIELLDGDAARQAMRKGSYLYARHMVWGRVAQSYMRSFARACAGSVRPTRGAFSVRTPEKNATNRPIGL